jgi:purine-binding chemotaxis protein CheW
MSSDNLNVLQKEAFAVLQRQGRTASPAIAALQQQLAQIQVMAEGNEAKFAPTVVGDQYLVFSLREREFAVKAELVQGVERLIDITPVPNIVSWVKGVINLRGSITSVVDFRMFLGLEHQPYSLRTRLLSLQCNDMVMCLIVDGVSEMLPIPTTAITREAGNARQSIIPPWISSYTAGSALLANRTMVLLDVERLLFSDKMQHYEMQGG